MGTDAAPMTASAPTTASGVKVDEITAASWPQLVARLPLSGLAAELARQSEWLGMQEDTLVLRVAAKTLAASESRMRLQTVLCEYFGQSLRLRMEVGATSSATPHAVAQTARSKQQQAAEATLRADPFVQALISDFGATVVPGSVRCLDPPTG